MGRATGGAEVTMDMMGENLTQLFTWAPKLRNLNHSLWDLEPSIFTENSAIFVKVPSTFIRLSCCPHASDNPGQSAYSNGNIN